ncbi:MAG: hypothetical protein AAFY71_04900 [Bacteroidota bacterium]
MDTQEEKQIPQARTWLHVLAEQSWNAELIVSGVAIFGSLRIPDLLTGLMNYSLFAYPDDLLVFGELMFIYFFLTSQILITGFMIHFAMRVLWIGMVGLYSVYPEGIKPIKQYSEDFNEKMKQDFPSLGKHIEELDNTASLIFAMSNLGAVTILALTIDSLVCMGLALAINYFLPIVPLYYAFFGILGLAVIPSFVVSFFHLKAIRDKPWVQKIHYPVYMFTSRLTLHIAFKPLNYTTLTLYSHENPGKVFLVYFLVSFFLGLLGGRQIFDSNLRFFDQEKLFAHSSSIEWTTPNLFEDERELGNKILHASIPSRIIDEEWLEVFIPYAKREQKAQEVICGVFEAEEDVSKEQERMAKRRYELECAKSFRSFSLDDSTVQPIDVVMTYNNESLQKGFIHYFPLEGLPQGKHVLEITSSYFSEEGEARKILIPFLYKKQLHPSNK